jgi:hypothetical protein
MLVMIDYNSEGFHWVRAQRIARPKCDAPMPLPFPLRSAADFSVLSTTDWTETRLKPRLIPKISAKLLK